MKMTPKYLIGCLIILLSYRVIAVANDTPLFKVGIINITHTLEPMVDQFKITLGENGFPETKKVTFLYDGPLGKTMAAESVLKRMLAQRPTLIFTQTTGITHKTMNAIKGSDINVVFSLVSDPVKSGFVESLRKPGGNMTGIRSTSFAQGGLDWMVQIIPDLEKLYVPFYPQDRSMAILINDLKQAASRHKIELVIAECHSKAEIVEAIETIPDDVQAVWELASLFWSPYVDQFIASAIRHRKPLMGANAEWAERGALMGFGHSNEALGRQAGRMAAKILEGISPADLPVESSEMFFHVNLRTAKAIGVKIPYAVLKQADTIFR